MAAAIREATPDDARLLASLVSRSFRTAAERVGLTREAWPRHPAYWRRRHAASALAKGIRFFVLECEGQPCGCAGLERKDDGACKLKRLAVLPERRRQGHGRALVDHVVAQARALGAPRLELGMFAGDTALQAWYERLGFRFKETKSFDHVPFAVTFMFLEL